MIKHKIGVVNTMFATWLTAFIILLPRAVMAASTTFSADVRTYDIESLMWAGIMSLFGGALRTIFTLATDANVVISVTRELWKDVLVAMISGLVAYIFLEAVRASNLWPVPSEVRFAAIIFAGWSRLSFFGWLNKMGTRVTDSITERMAGFVGGGVLAGPPAPTRAVEPNVVRSDTAAPAPTSSPVAPPVPTVKAKPFKEK